jgi:hypothetical protein
MTTCRKCDGSGKVWLGVQGPPATCPECNGSGHIKLARNSPLEQDIADALTFAQIEFVHESPGQTLGPDFYLPQFGLYLEVKGGHTPRIAKQMARVSNVIAVQGVEATKFLVGLLTQITKM